MVTATCLLFLSQFFTYSERIFVKPDMDTDFSFHNGSLTLEKTGWDWHSWYSGVVIALIAYLFYSKTRSLFYYIVSIVIMFALALGTGTGATMGLISVALAGYAIHLKRRESKVIKT